MKYQLEKENDPILLGIELEAECPVRHQEGEGDHNSLTESQIRTIAKASTLEVAFGRDGGGIETMFSPASYKWLKANKHFFSQVLNTLKDARYKGDSSRTAGIHIHIDRKAFTKENFVDFISWLRENKEFLHDFSHRGQRTGYTNIENTTGKSNYSFKEVNREDWTKMFAQTNWTNGFGTAGEPIGNLYECNYCGAVTSSSREGAQCQWCHDNFNAGDTRGTMHRQDTGRIYHDYVGNDCLTLNHNGNGTIECRFFNSTLDIERFMANIDFIHALVFFIRSDREKTLQEFLKYCADYAYKYESFVKFYLIPKGHLEGIAVKTFKRKLKKKKRSNVHFN